MKNCLKCPRWPAMQSHFILCNDNYLFSQGFLYPPQASTTTHGPPPQHTQKKMVCNWHDEAPYSASFLQSIIHCLIFWQYAH